ncbi:uncharacterized protein LOC111618655 [Centruroides sculpturatus]|uniref:uncharacterized protein LOC111618655 n=1 Tax=Centruroides sculpturatus TaxID=218467 RepID=UPI000C6D0FAF|nr:uncharacterized protein LOC111618655 [Centruroides sculpturatus]
MILFVVIALQVYFVTIKKLNGNDYEALLCSIVHSVRLMYWGAHIVSLLFLFSILFTVICLRMNKLTTDLIELKRVTLETKPKLESIFVKHTEIWEIFEMLNVRWKVFIPILYLHFVYVSCFLTYAAIFVEMDYKLKILIATVSVLFTSGILIISWVLSAVTSLLYDDFISVGRFTFASFPPLFKFKIIGFMKRFRGIPMGISMADFIYIMKNFIIKVVSSLYSVFSSMIQLSGVMRKDKTCLVPSTNVSLADSLN